MQKSINHVKPIILIVDDRPENLLALEAILEDIDTQVLPANSGAEALSLILENEFALILLDVQMPDMDGYEVAEIIKKNPATENIPIIFLTALSKDNEHIHRGYTSGAVDYLTKPLDTPHLLAKVRIFLKIWQQNHELNILNQKYEQVIQQLAQQRDQLDEISIRDHLTGLYQRRIFDEMLEKEILKSHRQQNHLSMAMLDLDFFKKVNDNYGQATGDKVLEETSKLMLQAVRASDVLCRFGGEEFLALMPDTTLEDAGQVCERIRQAIANLSITTDQGELKVTISIGVAMLDNRQQETAQSLFKRADDKLYQAKADGRNNVQT